MVQENQTDPKIEQIDHIRDAVRQLCQKYGEDYWLEMDRNHGYPTEFVNELTDAGFLGVLIPEQYGGSGIGRIGGRCGHGRSPADPEHMPVSVTRRCTFMGSVLRHGSEAQKSAYLPRIASGELRLQSFGVTEPTTGSDHHSTENHCPQRGK